MLIGFNGRLGAGKDTAAERLLRIVDLPATQISFAAKLKESAAAVFDIPVEDWETYKNDPNTRIVLVTNAEDFDGEDGQGQVISHMNAREFLQRYGTEAHRDIFGQDFWVREALKSLPAAAGTLNYVTDVRFVNEATRIQQLGGIVVQVQGVEDDTGSHVSEAQLSPQMIDWIIDNSVRDDEFRHLDTELYTLATQFGLPLKEAVSA